MTQNLIIALTSLVMIAGCASTDATPTEANLETETSVVVTEAPVEAETVVEETEAELELADANVEESTSNLNPDRKVCKTVEVTGSRIKRKRICRTAAQWEALEDATENDFRRRLRNAS